MLKPRAMEMLLVLCCAALFLIGCRSDNESFCPAPSLELDPETIPNGDNDSLVTVSVDNPSPNNGREVLSELYADSGSFDDPNALETRYTCAHDVTGEVEICVDVAYGPPLGPAPGIASEAIGAAVEYLRAPTAYFFRPEDCLETACSTVVCPSEKNACPVIDELSVDPEIIADGETATVRVVAEDSDENPAPLVTMLSATAGTFGDRFASETTYSCNPEVGGTIEICVEATDGDESCDAKHCITVECPGPPPDNVCPVIRDLRADPSVIPPTQTQSVVVVDAFDPDADNPLPLVTILSASAGTFDDPNAPATTFNCGAPGPAEICVKATDGDKDCNKERCITVQCPSTVPDNFCPKLYVLNAIPSDLRDTGKSWTEIQVRAEDDDLQPLPLITTLYALRGFFDDVHAKNTIYQCERAGLNEVCVDASDGACVKTLCIDVICPPLP
jgi:hypothetical protein